LTATLASTVLINWGLLALPDYAPKVLASGIVILFASVNLCGVKWVMRLAMPVAAAAAALAFCTGILPITSGSVEWHQAFSFHLSVPVLGGLAKSPA
jgi:CBS domain containing-hemolysin-like protein